MYISVVGASECGPELAGIAYGVGAEVARRGHILVCGGLGGVMEAASRGASESGGRAIGILPGPDRAQANRYLSVAIPTDMGHARNVLVAMAGDSIIAVGGSFGTLSEIAIGLKLGKPVIGLATWDLPAREPEARGVVRAAEPAEALDLAESMASG